MTNSDFAYAKVSSSGTGAGEGVTAGICSGLLFGLEMGLVQRAGRATNRGQVWVPAAAVIPTLLVNFNVAAFKTFVVYGVITILERGPSD